MRENIKNPNLIVKNGAYLFLRLLLVLALAFYTTRLTLQILGDENYGINNVVGGIISVFAIISMPITGTLQRFFNVEFTKQELPGAVVFSTSLRIIMILSLIMVVLYETIGLYLVTNVLSYPTEKTFVVQYIFQLAVITSVVNLYLLPFSALLYSKENMGIPATIEIVSSILRLGLLFLIPFVPTDILIAYASILLIISVLQLCFYIVYCHRKYDETHIQKTRSKLLQKNILEFAGWSSINAMAGILITYLSNIFINIFGGVLYNTAYGISRQLSNAVVSFSTNVLKAVDPQITNATVSGQNKYRDSLALSSVKLSLLGTGFCYVVFGFYGDYLLQLWLGHVPAYVEPFCRLSLLTIVFTSISLPLRTIIMATGDIKRFFIVYGIISLLGIVLMYILLKMKAPVIIVMYLILMVDISNCLNVIIRVHQLSSLKIKDVLKASIPVIIVLSIGGVLLFICSTLFNIGIVQFLLVTMFSFLIVCILAFYIVMTKSERAYVLTFVDRIKSTINRNK